MTNEQMERAIEFLLEHHTNFSSDIEKLKEAQAQQAANLDRLAGVVSVMQTEMEANRVEIRDAINSLIVANEATRGLAEKAAQLAIQTSQRVTNLESDS